MSARFKKGQSLVEVLLALSVFILGVVTIGLLVIDADFASRQGVERSKAVFLAEEGLEAARSIRDGGFKNLLEGTHGISVGSGVWELLGTSDAVDQFTRTLTISDVSPTVKRAISHVEWQFTTARTSVVELVTYLSNFLSRLWHQTTRADFSGGLRNSVIITDVNDGEIELLSLGDWTGTSVVATLNLTGNTDATETIIFNDELYVSALQVNGPEFVAIDISNVSNGTLTPRASFEANTDVYGFAIDNNFAFLATADNGAEVVAVRLSDMVEVATFDVPSNSNALGIFASGGTAYVTTEDSNSEELYILDVSDPLSGITQIAAVEVGTTINAVAVSSGYAFLATDADSGEIVIVRLSDFTVVNTVNLGDVANATDVAINGTTLYVTRLTSSDNELYALDVSTPEGSVPILRSRDLGTNAHALEYASNGRVYVATASNTQELMVFDAATFTLEGSGDSPGTGDARAVSFFGAHAYLGTDENSSEVSALQGDSGGWMNPTLVSSFDTNGVPDANDVFVSGGYAYVVTQENTGASPEFYIIDVSAPLTPILRGSLDLNAAANKVFVSGSYAYIASSDNGRELIIVDISNPLSPVVAGTYNTIGNEDALSVFSLGSIVYLGKARGGGAREELYLFDVSAPATPVLLGSYEVNADVFDLQVSGGIAYLATGDNGGEFLTLDVSIPASIVSLGVYNAPGNNDAHGIFYSTGVVYLVREDGGGNHDFFILNVSLPATPALLGSLDLGSDNTGIFVSGNNAFVSTELSAEGLKIVDVVNVASPQLVGTFNTSAGATGIFYDSGYIFLSTRSNASELQIVEPGSAPPELSREGRFVSSPFDSGSPGTVWGDILWTESGSGGLSFKLRSANTEANLSNALWVGSDGTVNTFYIATGTAITTDPGASGVQWMQYKAYFSGDGSTTTVLHDVSLSY